MNIAKKREEQTTVLVLGLRGFPNVVGGVETHAENLYPLISDLGPKVICVTRSPYHDRRRWSGIEFLPMWAPRSKFFEAIIHSVAAVIRAAFIRPNVVHIHGVGPSLVVPLARILGLKVVVTHHGPTYDSEKWNAVARGMLRIGEWCAARFANELIVISPVIADAMRERYNVECTIIPNGVRMPKLDGDVTLLDKHGLQAGRYVLLVSRFVPEKRHFDLIDAFESAAVSGVKLALVGDAHHSDYYERALKDRAATRSDIVLTGFLGGDELDAVYQYASVFVLPSSLEGLPIALLEALSFGLPCLASSIPANRSVGLDDDMYFDLGNTDQLARKIKTVLAASDSDRDRDTRRQFVAEAYDWKRAAIQTTEIFERMNRLIVKRHPEED